MLCATQLSAKQNSEKPMNLVIILADDLGFGDLGFTGSTQIKTPHIDQLATDGVVFTNGYSCSAVCSPSRAGLLTGRNQVTFGFDNNIANNQPGFDEKYLGLPVNVKTIANHLDDAGYCNGIVGKWHLGDQEHFHPLKRGFDEWWGFLGGGHHYFKSEPGGKDYLSPVESNYKKPDPITYITDDIGTECVDFIERNSKKPFFLFASFNAPHAPMHATDEDLRLYSHIKDVKRRTYAAMVHRLDENVGRIIAEIKKQGLEQQTMVVFLSDNGGPVNSNASLNAPYRGQKGSLLEGGIHVPYVMKIPGVTENKTSYQDMVSSLDIMPTFLSLANVKYDASELDGTNLSPFLKSGKAAHETLEWRFTISAAIRSGDWKLVRLPDRLPMLYNLKEDKSELDDRLIKQPERAKRMLKQLGNWDVSLPHPVFLEGAVWKKRQLKLYDLEYRLSQPK
ncbi:sulfatase [Prolixibacteraceae bacterium JC049]|nr:sulfatase [Prolixibacteraceae bacterium JC049]